MEPSSAAPAERLCRCAAHRAEPHTSPVSGSARNAARPFPPSGRGPPRRQLPSRPLRRRRRCGSSRSCSSTSSVSPLSRSDATPRTYASCWPVISTRPAAIVGRYGGVLEKFIGDAVMAVWGVPTAREDDAERAVRAGLEIVDAVAALGAEVGDAGAAGARAGVVTGQVAALDAPRGRGPRRRGPRQHRRARPVGRESRDRCSSTGSTRRGDIGLRSPTRTAASTPSRARPSRCGYGTPNGWSAGVGGARPRARAWKPHSPAATASLRLLKELFHDALARHSARLVAARGEAGVGKSRLAVGVLQVHRRPRRHDPVAHGALSRPMAKASPYWALAEMVRQRLGDPTRTASQRSVGKRASRLGCCAPWMLDGGARVPDAAARAPCSESPSQALGRDELFAGWRLFFERLAEQRAGRRWCSRILQWADDGLLEFIETHP